MGLLVDGKWVDRWYDTGRTEGRFVRSEAAFRNFVTQDGSPGVSGKGGFAAESGRYHLFIAHACPWAHRALIFRKLMGLEPHIGLSVVHPFMGAEGWTFDAGDKVIADPVMGARRFYDLYIRAKVNYSGRVTVPILWDLQRDTIVSNESSEIIRMFNGAFRKIATPLAGDSFDMWPEDLREELEGVNERVYHAINNGVYKAGFATTQGAYEEAANELFAALDEMELRLSTRRYLMGERLTEADWRLFTTLIRFDLVYHGHFKCNRRAIREYPNLWGHTRELYQYTGIAETVHFDHITEHYHGSHESINPHRIIPLGPQLDLDEPHGRGAKTG
jgi:putative glutathione S-transferase